MSSSSGAIHSWSEGMRGWLAGNGGDAQTETGCPTLWKPTRYMCTCWARRHGIEHKQPDPLFLQRNSVSAHWKNPSFSQCNQPSKVGKLLCGHRLYLGTLTVDNPQFLYKNRESIAKEHIFSNRWFSSCLFRDIHKGHGFHYLKKSLYLPILSPVSTNLPPLSTLEPSCTLCPGMTILETSINTPIYILKWFTDSMQCPQASVIL